MQMKYEMMITLTVKDINLAKLRLERDLNPRPPSAILVQQCSTQLSYQANWELVFSVSVVIP